MQLPAPTSAEKVLMDADALRRTLSRIAHEIIEANPDLTRVALVGILVQMFQTPCIERACTAYETMHLVSVLEQQFGQVRTILTGNSGN